MIRNKLADKKKYLLILSISVPVLFIFLFYFKRAGNWLTYSDDLTGVRPDVIFLFGGGGPHRAEFGIQLMKMYPCALFIVSEKDSGGFIKLTQQKIPKGVKLKFISGMKNTIAEVDYLNDNILFLKKKPTIVLASSPYHMRRIKILAERKGLYRKGNIYITHMPFDRSPYSKESFDLWFKYKKTREMVIGEVIKIVRISL